MHSLEAITRLIEHGNRDWVARQKSWVEQTGEMPEVMPDEDGLGTALAVVQAVLNTALPIARFRLHVECLTFQTEYTISTASIRAIRGVLMQMRNGEKNQEVMCSLWEQEAGGAEMISGFRGFTRAANFKMWLKQIEELANAPKQRTQIPEVPAAIAGSEEGSVKGEASGEEKEA